MKQHLLEQVPAQLDGVISFLDREGVGNGTSAMNPVRLTVVGSYTDPRVAGDLDLGNSPTERIKTLFDDAELCSVIAVSFLSKPVAVNAAETGPKLIYDRRRDGQHILKRESLRSQLARDHDAGHFRTAGIGPFVQVFLKEDIGSDDLMLR